MIKIPRPNKRIERAVEHEKVVTPIEIGANETTPKTLPKRLKYTSIKTNIGELQETVILNTARILRKILEV